MGWFNYIGLIVVVTIMVPNIAYAIKQKDSFNNSYKNKAAEIFEQIGRYGCMAFMIFNIPYTYIGFYFKFADIAYIVVNAILVLAYCLSWLILWKKNSIVKFLLLSIIPAFIFLFSSIMLCSIPLLVCAVIFAACHTYISIKSGIASDASTKIKRNGIITVSAILLAIVILFVGTLGGILGYQSSRLGKINSMSVEDMINYDCTQKDKKISIALIENAKTTFHTYGSNGEESNIYDYEIGSISKTFVGLLCAKSVSDGKLNLTDNISKYLDLEKEKYYPTIERLLTHTSGYKAYYFENSMISNKFAHISNDFCGISKDEILEKVKSQSLEDKDYPFVYSNFGISVIGLVLEKIYNKPFIELMNDYIANELNLTETKVAKQGGNLSGYWKWNSDDGYMPAGSIVSNINDMAKYLQIYINNSLNYSANTYVKIKDINANNAAYEEANIRMDGCGMTWMLDDKNGIIWHNGGTTNFNAYIGFTKDRQKGVVILSNLSPNDKIPMTVIGAKILTQA